MAAAALKVKFTTFTALLSFRNVHLEANRHLGKCYSRVVVLARLVVSRRTGTSYSAYTSSFTLFSPYMVVSRHPRGTLFSPLTSPICLQVHRTLFLAEISRRHHPTTKYLHVRGNGFNARGSQHRLDCLLAPPAAVFVSTGVNISCLLLIALDPWNRFSSFLVSYLLLVPPHSSHMCLFLLSTTKTVLETSADV